VGSAGGAKGSEAAACEWMELASERGSCCSRTAAALRSSRAVSIIVSNQRKREREMELRLRKTKPQPPPRQNHNHQLLLLPVSDVLGIRILNHFPS